MSNKEFKPITATWSACWHTQNGHYFTARFWIFKKRYWVCRDCWSVIEARIYDALKRSGKK